MMKTYKFKLYPTATQANTFYQWIGGCRFIYNLGLEHRITAYKSCQQSVSYKNQQNELPELKKTQGFEWLKNIQSQVLQDALKRLDKAYKAFFKGGGFPKWAKKHKYQSFTFPQIKTLFKENKLNLPKIGLVRILIHRKVKGTPKTITIVNQNNHWYACITCEKEPRRFQGDNQTTGIDLGVARLATLSNGDHFDNPLFFKKYQQQLRIKQRKLSRQKKYGINWMKTKKQINKLHTKISRCRKDYLHKVSQVITCQYNTIVVENLKLSNMTKSAKGDTADHGKNVKQKSGLNRSLLDTGLGIFLHQLEYKTKWQGGTFLKVDPKNTSRACSKCGYVDQLNRRSQSIFKCVQCSFALNADHNAAKNILSKGALLLSLT